MTYSNSQILSAVLANYLQPIVSTLSNSYVKKIPFLSMIENKVKSWGLTSPNWSIADELAPFTEVLSSNMIEPMINKYLSNMPDDSIPQLAHSIVDKAVENGELKILDGYITLDSNDLKRLKDLLNWNLPVKESDKYHVKMSEEEVGGENNEE